MYLKPYRMQNVMNAFTAVLFLIPIIMLIFSLVSFTQEGQIRDVSGVLCQHRRPRLHSGSRKMSRLSAA